MKPELIPGIAAISRKGRDKGRLYVVLCQLDADFVLVSDGRARLVSHPKKKRTKHLMAIGHNMPGFAQGDEQQPPTDQHIRAFLTPLIDLYPQ